MPIAGITDFSFTLSEFERICFKNEHNFLRNKSVQQLTNMYCNIGIEFKIRQPFFNSAKSIFFAANPNVLIFLSINLLYGTVSKYSYSQSDYTVVLMSLKTTVSQYFLPLFLNNF